MTTTYIAPGVDFDARIAACPRCTEAVGRVLATKLTLLRAVDHGEVFCAAQSVETWPGTYGHPRAYFQVRTIGCAS